KELNQEKYEITFDVENKRDDTIIVTAKEVSSNDKMIDNRMLFMHQEISPGKSADAVLSIENIKGELPEIKETLEMTYILCQPIITTLKNSTKLSLILDE